MDLDIVQRLDGQIHACTRNQRKVSGERNVVEDLEDIMLSQQ
jgi:hypothetical protein